MLYILIIRHAVISTSRSGVIIYRVRRIFNRLSLLRFTESYAITYPIPRYEAIIPKII